MKINTFNLSTLGVAAAMMGTLVAAAVMAPPTGVIVAPKASFSISSFAQSAVALLHVKPMHRAERKNLSNDQSDAYEVVVIDGLDYDLDSIISGVGYVPRVQLASMPEDLANIRAVNYKKEIFFKTVLPLVLQINEEISADRQRLKNISAQIKAGTHLAATDKLWLAIMADRYNVRRNDIDAILARHDVVPPSLALAQAASESAWGTSRFVREGNAMFGQWTFSDTKEGLVPNKRSIGKSHRVQTFSSLMASVRSYVNNLNRHRAYREFRKARTAMRAKGGPIDGYLLATTLHRYSERGDVYVSELQSIIDTNALRSLDNARLMDIDPLI